MLGTICSEADDKLFATILLNPFHLLHHLIPLKRYTHYSLRPDAHDFTLSQFELLHSVKIISSTECYIKTLVSFDNIATYVFHFNLTAILFVSLLTVTFIKLLLTYLLAYLLTYLSWSIYAKRPQAIMGFLPGLYLYALLPQPLLHL